MKFGRNIQNTLLTSEVSEEVATQFAKNCRRRQPHSHLRLRPRGTPANISMHLIFPETRVIGLHFVAASTGLSSLKFVQWASQDASFLQQSAFRLFKVIHPRSMLLVPIASAYATSYLSPIVTMVLSCTVSEIRRLID